MSRLSPRRFPALLLVLLIALAPVAASATPISFPEVPRFVQFLLSVLSGDQGSTAGSEEEGSDLQVAAGLREARTEPSLRFASEPEPSFVAS